MTMPKAAVNHWRIIKPGLSSTFQDTGRFNFAHMGVPVSGALDLPAAQYANKLLANDLKEAVIEITLTGMSFETTCDCSIAVTGAVFTCQVNDMDVDHGQTINLKKGDVFNDDQIDAYINLKMEEVEQWEQTPSPIEFKMYYSV